MKYIDERVKPKFNDQNPRCTECGKSFDEHDENDELVCRQHALRTRATMQTIDYLNEGFANARKVKA